MLHHSFVLLAQLQPEKQSPTSSAVIIVLLGIAALVCLFLLVAAIAFAAYGKLWFQAYMSSADVSMMSLIGMGFRQVNSRVIIQAKIMAAQAGLDIGHRAGITTKRLEAHYLAGGNVPLVVRSLIAAHKAKIIRLSFREATAIDLAGRNVLEAVQTSVYPKVIDCPGRGGQTLDAVARNGIQLKVRARVTVRANLQRLIGGATEETIIARVGEGIVSAIGKSDDHMHVLENPDRISQEVLDRQLDANTAFEIVSIDIADIDVGENVGARLRADQAEADTRVARARAEGRRAAAVAAEQEQIARIEESRAKLVEAEAEVPKAMADSFRTGRLGILDYYKLRNLSADTNMRQAIAGTGSAQGRG